jgi:hypothetical protein
VRLTFCLKSTLAHQLFSAHESSLIGRILGFHFGTSSQHFTVL